MRNEEEFLQLSYKAIQHVAKQFFLVVNQEN